MKTFDAEECLRMRVTRFALVWMAILAGGATAAQAQTTTGSGSGPWYYGDIAVGATLGHKSDSSVSGEFGRRLNEQLEVFLEVGRMGNVATSELDARATKVANFLGGSASAVQKAKFFDVGVKYRGPIFARMWRPYIGLGIGVANVETLVNFAVNGTDVTAQLPTVYGIELGNDLSDSLTKTFIVVPLGVRVDFARRYFVDGSYRFGRILARPEDIGDDVGISTQRLQIAVGVRF